MNISAISEVSEHCSPRRNLFIKYSNSFMSKTEGEDPVEKAGVSNPIETESKPQKMGIETLEHFTIFPKETVNGKTIITA